MALRVNQSFSSFCLAGWLILLLLASTAAALEEAPMARLRYGGGGDWYNDPEVLPNLFRYFSRHYDCRLADSETIVSLSDSSLFDFPALYLTGHGNINFSPAEARTLREYLEAGGFLYADDDYGMDEHFRREIAKVLPGIELQLLGSEHSLFHFPFPLENGLPKIHEHEEGPPRAFGMMVNGRLAVLYTWNSNISDGWADPQTHENPPAVRETALQMGVNILTWILTR